MNEHIKQINNADSEVLKGILINSIGQAFENFENELNNNRKFITREEYIAKQQIKLKGLLCENSIVIEASNEYYNDICKYVESEFTEKTIPKFVYDSLEVGQQFHFNKHYNIRGNKVI